MTNGTAKKQKLKPAYLITGSDEAKVEKAAGRLRARVAEDAGTELNIDVFDASQDNAGTVLQAANTLPFGESVRLVMVRNIGGWHKAEKDIIASFLSGPPEYCCLTLVGSGLRKNEALYKAVAGIGEVLTYNAPRPSDFPAWVMKQAAGRKLKMEPDAARRLVTLAGTDQRVIHSELDKLAAYKGRGKVEMSDVDAICWISTDVKVWDLTDALGSRDRKQAFRYLEELLADRTEPNSILYTITTHLKRLSEVTEARERGEDPARIAAALGMKPYPAKKIVLQSRNFTSKWLRQAMQVFSDLDADLKGRSDLRADLALEIALSRALDEGSR